MISCIIPCHNASATLVRAIRSVFSQGVDVEVVLVDDASKDGSPALAASAFAAEHAAARLQVIQLATNHGPGLARNIGVAASGGQYLAFLDADDEHLPGYYAACAAWLDEHTEAAGVEVGAEIISATDGTSLVDVEDPRYVPIVNSVPWTVFVRREAFWGCGGFPVANEFRKAAGGEDIVFKSLLKQLFSIASSPQKLVRHYVYPGSHTDKYLRRTEIVDGKVVFKEFYTEETSGSWDAAAHEHVQRAKSSALALGNLLKPALAFYQEKQ